MTFEHTFKEQAEQIHIGQVIAQTLSEMGMSKAEFGRRINISRQNVNSLLRKQHLDTYQLLRVSLALRKNLFAVYYHALGGGEDQWVPPERAVLMKDLLELGQLHSQWMTKLMVIGGQMG